MGATNYYLSGASAVFGQLKPPSSGTPAVEWFSNMVQASWFQAIAPPIAFVLIGMYAKRLGRREGDESMSRKLWVRFFHCLEGIHREVTFQRPLLAAPQGYLRSQCARTHLVGKHPYYPRPPLYLPKEPLEHVRRAYAGMVASGVA